MSKHSPLPWREHPQIPYGWIVDSNNERVANWVGPADLDLIVRAVNSHADLVAACKAALDRHSYQGTGEPWSDFFDQARAALAKAGETCD